MFTNLYNQTTLWILSKSAQEKLENFAKLMPKNENGQGRFWNLHNDSEDVADAIGMQADGTVVYLSTHGYCSINPMSIDTKNNHPLPILLHTGSCGGVFSPDYNYGNDVDWNVSINNYNTTLYNASKVIVAVYTFDRVEPKVIPEIDIDVDLFIIPNSLGKLNDFYEFARSDKEQLFKDVLDTNGYTYDKDNEFFVETWAVGKSVDSDNLHDHGFTVTIDGQEVFLRFPGRFLPASIFEGKCEGDTIELKIPVSTAVRNSKAPKKKIQVMLNAKITLAQLKYRYGRFGTFDEVLNRLKKSYRD